LSILVPRPIRVSPSVARSMQQAGLDLDVVLDHDDPHLRILRACRLALLAEPVGARDAAVVDRHPVPEPVPRTVTRLW
jgi:hypothetical protein